MDNDWWTRMALGGSGRDLGVRRTSLNLSQHSRCVGRNSGPRHLEHYRHTSLLSTVAGGCLSSVHSEHLSILYSCDSRKKNAYHGELRCWRGLSITGFWVWHSAVWELLTFRSNLLHPSSFYCRVGRSMFLRNVSKYNCARCHIP
jgi:hypothetical protein